MTRYQLILVSRLPLEEADQRLRRALKMLLRGYGLRCTYVALAREDRP